MASQPACTLKQEVILTKQSFTIFKGAEHQGRAGEGYRRRSRGRALSQADRHGIMGVCDIDHLVSALEKEEEE